MFLAPNYNTDMGSERYRSKPVSLERHGMRPALNQIDDFGNGMLRLGFLALLGHFLYKRFSSGQLKKWHSDGCIEADHTVL